MKIRRIFTALLLTFALVVNNVSNVLALPPLPSSFFGTVKIDGANVPDGTVVYAKIGGVTYASRTVSTHDSDTIYYLDVPGDDPATPGIEGGVWGNTVVFFIGTIQATQNGTWYSGTNVKLDLLGFTPPGAFNKTSPINAATGVATNPTISWGTSSGATSYEYCYATTTGCSAWTSVGTNTSVGLTGLGNSQVYYWQVRAVNAGGTTMADSGTYWSFTTIVAVPGAFNKTSPINAATGVAVNPTISWGTSSGATSYEYCYAITTGCSAWTSAGTNTSVGLTGLSNSQVYYWQVRAVNAGGNTQANSGTYWSFTTIVAAPGAFNKTSPANTSTGVAVNPTISWGTSSGATSYEYCYATTTGCTIWTSVGTNTSVGLTGLGNSQVYYWQVRAVNAGGTTMADSGTYWSFTTIVAVPGAFNKTSPINAATGVAVNPTISWGTSSGATSYEYCYAITTGCSAWTSAGTNTSVGLTGLSNSQVYYWQVRAVNAGGTTMADSGTYWSFTTIVAVPGAFNKTSPANTSTGVAVNPTISWGTSSGATSYEYCYATTTGCSAWTSVGTNTSVGLTGLSNSQVYYWQVRAVNAGGNTQANSGTYWSFTTIVAGPGAFNKTSPINAATGVATNPTISWGTSSGATSYEYCYATTTGCSAWTSVGTNTSVGLTGLGNSQVYYWQVRAVNAGGNTQANSGTYWSFTTIVAAPGAFNKTSPANTSTGVAVNPTISWGTSSGATSYEYCYATTTGCTIWTSVGTNTSVGLTGLGNSQVYYWQVRAVNAGGTTMADSGTYWSFTTIVAVPGAFNKTSPINAATGVAVNPTISWGTSSGATSYEYCYAITTGCSAWTSAGTNTSVGLTGLSNSQVYYWQVRAVNAGGTTMADSGTYWSFTTIVAVPGAFNKTSPINAATGVAVNPTISWGTSSGATSYEYCYAITTGCASWISAGTNTSVGLTGLGNSQVYYWQVRAVNAGGTTMADSGTYWSFTTIVAVPGAFNKTSPANTSTGVAVNPTISWGTSSGATSYEYCYATTTGCSAWTSVGTNTSVGLTGLSNSQVYYWQVRAVNVGGNTQANSGTYWSFTTIVAGPGAFNKTSPINAATGVATNPTISWGTSSGATSYEYCYATTTGCSAWTSVGTNTSVGLTGLSNSQVYYWQVRAVNAGGTTMADSGTYWSFTTIVAGPGAFNKTSPINAATGVATNPTISWGTSSGATSYEYCYATTTGCSAWTSVGTNTSAGLTGLSNSQVYYWQVRAVNAGGNTQADSGTYWSFTTIVAGPGAFNKTSPANTSTGVAVNPTISWGTSSGATSYEYCYATTTGCSAWTSAGTNTSAGLTGLSNSQVYYWQVRAVNAGGNTQADSGTYWSFTTIVAAPGAFNKTNPINAATGVAVNPTISWGTSSGATSYEYCYATTTGCSAWTSARTNTSAGLIGLSNSHVYYWQVRAVNAGGNTLADSGTYWSFTTIVAGPGAFNKTSPANTSTGVATNPTISWGTSSGATSYEYCYATTTGCSAWTSVGTNTSVGLTGLSNSQVYYWQVRAVNAGGTTMADSGTYWSFTTIVAGPGAFNKTSPANTSTGVATNPTISWGTSSGATFYEYCYATTTGCAIWTSVGTNTSVGLTGLSNSQVYYWQVRAVNAGGTTMADSGTYWSFTTIVAVPGAFNKTSPANTSTGVAVNPTISWGTSSGATSYEYCYATTTGCSAWTSVGTNTSVGLTGLSNSQVYYWQVRAVNVGGNTQANSGTYWSFTTIVAGPGAFNKTSPINAATGVATNPTISWGTSSGATSYEYCYAVTTGCTIWTSVGTNTSVGLTGLSNSQVYYWQVRAVNVGGNTQANSGTYWSFTTIVAGPGAFNKTSPANTSTGVAVNPTISWGTSSGATSYEYCYATTTGCTIWTSVGTNTSVGLTGLSNNQVYYWQVRAVNAGGNTQANSGTYWSFTTIVAGPGAFNKTSPANTSTGVATNPTISWGTSSGATSYEYCYATTTGCSAWTSVGTNTSVGLTGLGNSQVYYWQVRAVNAGGTTMADSGTYWSFTTIVAAPGAFNKTSPANTSTGVAVNPTISWGTSSGATSYEYCYATTTGCSAWTSAGTNTSVGLTGLSNSQVYYWQVRAVNAGGTTMADSGTYWSFTTIVAVPGAFNKTSPINAATGVAVNPTISWGTSSGATSYEYCYAITTGCASWISAGTNTSVGLTGLGNSQVYYWQVRAVNVGGTTMADSGTYWSFTITLWQLFLPLVFR